MEDLDKVNITLLYLWEYLKNHPDWRLGQALFNIARYSTKDPLRYKNNPNLWNSLLWNMTYDDLIDFFETKYKQ